MTYRCGRFAPSPTGYLHFGSLLAAVASWAIAKQQGARWLLRIEDLDPPRAMPGATEAIIDTLYRFGFRWDGEIVYQSRRDPLYWKTLQALGESGRLYPCQCSRSEIRDRGHSFYDNYCADKSPVNDIDLDTLRSLKDVAWRFVHGHGNYRFDDFLQGKQGFELDLLQEDFIVRRRDALWAYHLAVVVDDIEQGVDHIVRGADLLDSTPRHLQLYEFLQVTPPDYYHIPLAVSSEGQKLSKQNFAPAILPADATRYLLAALDFLGQEVDIAMLDMEPEALLQRSIKFWQTSLIPTVLEQPIDPVFSRWMLS